MIPLSDNIRSRRTPVVNVGLILTCLGVFAYQVLRPEFAGQWAFRPAYLLSWQLLEVGPVFAFQSMLVSVFLHGGLLHIGANMLFLWVFGDNVEDRLGHVKYLLFYLFCGVVATLVHSLSAVWGLLHDPASLERGVVGASGAIAGVLGAYLVLVPGASVRSLVILFIFITIINIPAPFFIALWFILQLFSGIGTLAGATTGVAYWAHIGGFAAGYAIARGLRPRRRPPRPRVLNIDIDDL